MTRIYAFADDSMRGRETGTENASRAMRFLVDRLQRLGLEPAGDVGQPLAPTRPLILATPKPSPTPTPNPQPARACSTA